MPAETVRRAAPGSRAARFWQRVDDLVAHCLEGKSLLLSGMPGTGKTHGEADRNAARGAGRGADVHL